MAQFEPFSVEFHPIPDEDRPNHLRMIVWGTDLDGTRAIKGIFEGEARWLRLELRRELAKMLPDEHADLAKR